MTLHCFPLEPHNKRLADIGCRVDAIAVFANAPCPAMRAPSVRGGQNESRDPLKTAGLNASMQLCAVGLCVVLRLTKIDQV